PGRVLHQLHVHSRFAIVATALTAMLAVAHPALAAGPYEVRRALTPDEAAAMRARGTPWTGAVLNPEQARIHALREDRMRRMPHRLAPDGFDWRAALQSRIGARHLSRNPHQRVTA